MVNNCVCAGCKSTTVDATLFRFPRNKAVAVQWHRFVNVSRKWTLTVDQAIARRSMICQHHFDESCFDPSQILKFDSGFQGHPRLKLLEGSVPTKHARTDQAEPPPKKKKRSESTVTKLEDARTKARLRAEMKKLALQRRAEGLSTTVKDLPVPTPSTDTPPGVPVDTAKESSPPPQPLLPLEPWACSDPVSTPSTYTPVAVDTPEEDTSSPPHQPLLPLEPWASPDPVSPKAPSASSTSVSERRHGITIATQTNIGMSDMDECEKYLAERSTKATVEPPPSSSVISDQPPSASKTPSPTVSSPQPQSEPEKATMVTKETLLSSPSSSSSSPVKDSESSYKPSSSDMESSPEKMRRPSRIKQQKYEEKDDERAYLIYEVMLLQLFVWCLKCGKRAVPQILKFVGTMVVIHQVCSIPGCEGYTWSSQPMIQNIAKGNVMLSTAILCSGNTASKSLRLLRFMGVKVYHYTTFYRHQKMYINGAVTKLWRSEQEDLLAGVGDSLILAGDARCDSMGHCAKYGSYTMMDVTENKILAMELVQKNEVASSYHMELEGFKRCKRKITESCNPNEIVIVTDRHPQINKYIKDYWREVVHYFDIWHVAKGLRKKLLTLANKFELVRKWVDSIINHMYWSATESRGNGDECLERWDSMGNHLINVHDHKENEIYKKCAHGPLPPREWMSPGTEEYESLMQVLESRYLRKDIKRLSPVAQTGSLEGFHSLVNQFAPKMKHFRFTGMNTRLLLAVLHYNENAGRNSKKDDDGNVRWNLVYPRGRHGKAIVRSIKEPPTFDYVDRVKDAVLYLLENRREAFEIEVGLELEAPRPLSHEQPEVDKEEVVRKMRARFPEKF